MYHDQETYDDKVSSTLGSLPVLVVANKKDLEDEKAPRTYNTFKDLGFSSVSLVLYELSSVITLSFLC